MEHGTPFVRPSFRKFLLTFSTSSDHYIKRWQSLAPKSFFVSVAMFLIRGSSLHN